MKAARRGCAQDGVESAVYSRAFSLMYIALINPLFTDVAFHRDSEGDGSGHYKSVPSAHLRACNPRPLHCSEEFKYLLYEI